MRAFVVSLLLLGVAAPAAAERRVKSDLDKAKAHYKAGEAFFNAGVYERAIVEYQAAYALTMRAPLLYNLGSAYRRKAEETGALEDKRSALELYQKYVAADPDGKGADEARRWIAALSAEVKAREAEAAARPVPPPPATANAPPTPAAVPEAVVAVPLAPRDAPRTSRRGLRIAGLATAGAGVALVGAGVVFGLKARSAADELDALPAGAQWDPDLYDRGESYNRNMFILGGLGAAAIAGGLVTTFVFGRDPVTVAPRPDGVVVSGRF